MREIVSAFISAEFSQTSKGASQSTYKERDSHTYLCNRNKKDFLSWGKEREEPERGGRKFKEEKEEIKKNSTRPFRVYFFHQRHGEERRKMLRRWFCVVRGGNNDNIGRGGTFASGLWRGANNTFTLFCGRCERASEEEICAISGQIFARF